jgi:hypothetical protein
MQVIWLLVLTVDIPARRTGLHERFEIFTAVAMKKAVFWDVTSCGSCKIDVSEDASA